ncbi:MAG: ribulose-phosphate 3-epimerase [Candidatus Omnitrophica bacterium CG11_big_fil_rev_8_21_14_0_20_64_10]|nr:MAG: ribulose-phosphate 3-epimerase [Candidatus Omnitrophica bacterium CG11_big_fil_rev_8_21_14_0_20_64_10]
MSEVKVAPSLLSADFGRLGEETRRMEQAGADWIHLDVMDGHFVPNLTIGPQVVRALRPITKLPLDVHLMIADPDAYGPQFVQAGADRVTFHAEAAEDLSRTIAGLKKQGVKVGAALRPQTDWQVLKPVLDRLDLVLVMTVNPGFGGQAFMSQMLPKVRALRQVYKGLIQVDGGINGQTAALCRQAGADVMVAGTYLFKAADPKEAIASLRAGNVSVKSCSKKGGEGACG